MYDNYIFATMWEFGHGLSYTSLSYSNLKLSSQKITETQELVVTVDVKNNIFQNSRGGGTGQHFAICNGFNATPPVSAVGWAANASNNNVLNANSTTIGHWTSALNFSDWQTNSVSDGSSISAVSVPFVNTAIGDLHVNFGVTPTGLESGGISVSYTHLTLPTSDLVKISGVAVPLKKKTYKQKKTQKKKKKHKR